MAAVSVKLDEEAMEEIVSTQAMLRKKGIRVSKKELFRIAIRTITKDPVLAEKAARNEKKDSAREAFEKLKKMNIKLTGDLIAEHDTVM